MGFTKSDQKIMSLIRLPCDIVNNKRADFIAKDAARNNLKPKFKI